MVNFQKLPNEEKDICRTAEERYWQSQVFIYSRNLSGCGYCVRWIQIKKIQFSGTTTNRYCRVQNLDLALANSFRDLYQSFCHFLMVLSGSLQGKKGRKKQQEIQWMLILFNANWKLSWFQALKQREAILKLILKNENVSRKLHFSLSYK